MFKLLIIVVLVAFGAGAEVAKEKWSTKIVNGKEAKLGEFPYQVSLQIMAPPFEPYHFCGGVLISPSTVLTTAGCANRTAEPLEHIIVTAGFVNLKSPGDYQQKARISRTIIHPDYPGGTALNNIGIHNLATPFILDEYVNIIALPKNESIPNGEVSTSGWGSISRNPVVALPDILQRDTIPIVPIEECIPIIQGMGFPLDETMVCTGPLDGGHGACTGDSGGPLVSGSGENSTLVGITTWTIFPCAGFNEPSVFTRVSHYLDFINNNTV